MFAPSPPPSPVVILDKPQLAENIGAAARVMANFGLEQLRLVAPRDGWPQSRAFASASGADWVLNAVTLFPSVTDAIDDLEIVYAATARPRETLLPVLTPTEAVAELQAASWAGRRVGFLFGAERAGLETVDIALCKAIMTLPIDPRFRSLNLAQAVAITAYEWRKAVEDAPPSAFEQNQTLADGAMMQGLFHQLEDALEVAGFFHPPEKKPAMVRNLRVALSRARFTEQEARTFRGVITALVRGRGQTFRKQADPPPSP